MAIYIPPHFACDRFEVARELAERDPFATLISTDGGEPWITHVPLAFDKDNCLVGHIARANPHSRLLEAGSPTIAIFHGPHAYISPRMYETTLQVPTWNYASVHVHGRPEVLGVAETLAELERLVQVFDPDWRVEADYAQKQSLGVMAFRLPIERIEIKLKMSQNKTGKDRLGVIEGLRKRHDEPSHAVADWVERAIGMGPSP